MIRDTPAGMIAQTIGAPHEQLGQVSFARASTMPLDISSLRALCGSLSQMADSMVSHSPADSLVSGSW